MVDALRPYGEVVEPFGDVPFVRLGECELCADGQGQLDIWRGAYPVEFNVAPERVADLIARSHQP